MVKRSSLSSIKLYTGSRPESFSLAERMFFACRKDDGHTFASLVHEKFALTWEICKGDWATSKQAGQKLIASRLSEWKTLNRQGISDCAG